MLTSLLRHTLALMLVCACLFSWACAKEPGDPGKIRVLLTVGGHGFEEEPFYAIFRAMPDVEWTKIEMPKEADRLKPGLRRDFDVIVMYDMSSFTPAQQEAFTELLQEGIGVVSLHHNLCSHIDWSEFRKIIGGKYLFTPIEIDGVSYKPSDYAHDQLMNARVTDKDHPIMKGVEDFQTTDEVYNHFWIDPGVKALLKTDHPQCEPRLAWVTSYGKSRVFYLMLGHDHNTYENPNYRKMIHQGIQWAADRQTLGE